MNEDWHDKEEWEADRDRWKCDQEQLHDLHRDYDEDCYLCVEAREAEEREMHDDGECGEDCSLCERIRERYMIRMEGLL